MIKRNISAISATPAPASGTGDRFLSPVLRLFTSSAGQATKYDRLPHSHQFGAWIAARWDVAPPARRNGALMAFVRPRTPWQVSLRHATLASPRITQTLKACFGVTLHWQSTHYAASPVPAVAMRIVNMLSSLQKSQTSIHLHQTFPTRARVEFPERGTHYDQREIHSSLHQLLAGSTTLAPALPRHTQQINLAVFHNTMSAFATANTQVLPSRSVTSNCLLSRTSTSTHTLANIRELVARTFHTQQWSSTNSSHSTNTIVHRTSGLTTHTLFRSRAWTVFGEGTDLVIRVNHEVRQSPGSERVSPAPSALRTRQTAPVSLSFVRHEDHSNTAITQTLAQIQQTLAANGKAREAAVPQVDIPYLTRQVYDQFERELRIERERRGL
jgi:hypothetical protein